MMLQIRLTGLRIGLQTVLAISAASSATLRAGPMVDLPPGTTRLSEIGVYHVGWQSYNGRPQAMPDGWSGHFTDDSGIAYLPGARILGREAILFHSPWRVAPGRMWVDYPLRLPDTRPIRLLFGIAMRPDVAVQGKSDGVTFSVWVDAGGGFRKLMRRHWDRGRWRDYEFDLSRYAGKAITLRFQVEPGPANNPSFDFSYFGDPRIVCGAPASAAADALQACLRSRAVKAADRLTLERLNNRRQNSVVPSNLLPAFSNVMERTGSGWRFRYRAEDADIAWVWRPQTGTLDDLTVSVDGGRPFRPAAGGGVFFARGPFRHDDVRAEGGRLVEARPAGDGRALDVIWEYPFEQQNVRVYWRFGVRGKALTVNARSDAPVFRRFSLGAVADAPLRRRVRVPYLPFDDVQFLPDAHLFVGRYLDWTASNSSQCPAGTAVYDCRTDGRRNPLLESGYVAVSPLFWEVLPNLPHPASPFRRVLAPRIMLDVWGLPGNRFEGEAANLRTLKDHGVDHLAVIIHVWQRYGYDVKLPDHIPANPRLGGDAGMKKLGRAANECGFIWAVHENYIDFYPDAPSYDPRDRVLREDGSPSPAWFNKGTGVQSFGLKCNKALKYARRNSPYIHRTYHTTAAYLDVHTCVPPWHQLDHDATQPFAAMERGKVHFDTLLFQYMRDTHGGPLFGEGHHQAFWAGRCDAVEAQVEEGEDHVPLLDFDLLKIHPQMFNHGMGYYERWFRTGYQTRWGQDAATPEQIDKYRAQEIAYGHAGFVGNAATANVQWVAKEHHLMYPIQRLYGAARVTDIRYEVGGKMVRAETAIALKQLGRQRITWDSGLTVWVNWEKKPWNVRGRVLPQWGFLALGPDTEVWTALVNGRLADWARTSGYVFADARTAFSMPYAHRVPIRPELALLEPVGGRRFRISYRWRVRGTIRRDGHCFVHFVHPAAQKGQDILFQQDHAPPRPTSQWRKGDVIEDGPYEVEVPEDLPAPIPYVDIVVGLYDRGGRFRLEGVYEGDRRVLIGRLRLQRDAAGRVVGVRPVDISDDIRKRERQRADFRTHLNPEGTWIDFGPAATDGSVKVEMHGRSLLIFPYPDGRRFRVALDVTALAGISPGASITIRALAPQSRRPVGTIPYSRDPKGRIVFDVGRPDAVCYRLAPAP